MKKNLGAPHEDARILGAPPKSEKNYRRVSWKNIMGALIRNFLSAHPKKLEKIWAHSKIGKKNTKLLILFALFLCAETLFPTFEFAENFLICWGCSENLSGIFLGAPKNCYHNCLSALRIYCNFKKRTDAARPPEENH